MGSEDGEPEFEVLPDEECRRRLAEGTVGRLAVVHDGQPLIFPVNYRYDGGSVVFRSNEGTKLAFAQMGKVAFEIDGLEAGAAGRAWSVVVLGTGQDVTSTLDRRSAEVRNLEVSPLVREDRDRWVEITPTSITGRRVGAREA